MKKKNKHDKLVLSAKTNLNITEVIIFKYLTDSCISHDEFALVNNLSKEYGDMEENLNRRF